MLNNVINLTAIRALKNPLWAMCHRLDNHETVFSNGLNVLAKEVDKTKMFIYALVISNFVSWLILGGLILAFINHDHSLYGLI